LLLLGVVAKAGQVVTEQVIAANNDNVVVDLVLLQNEMHVADRAEPVLFVSALIVHDREAEVQVWTVITFGPLLEVGGKLCIRDDVRVIDGANGGDVVDDVLE